MEEEIIKRNLRRNKIKIIADVILIIVILLIGFYIYSEVENFKMLGQDSCRLCEQKTGGVCMMDPIVADSFNDRINSLPNIPE